MDPNLFPSRIDYLFLASFVFVSKKHRFIRFTTKINVKGDTRGKCTFSKVSIEIIVALFFLIFINIMCSSSSVASLITSEIWGRLKFQSIALFASWKFKSIGLPNLSYSLTAWTKKNTWKSYAMRQYLNAVKYIIKNI